MRIARLIVGEMEMQNWLSLARKPLAPTRLLFAVWIVSAAVSALAQSDNFDDGNDAGWRRYAPLAALGVPASYSFPNGGYRIQSAPSPDPAALGPARAGSLRTNVYSRFQGAIDLAAWDTNLNEAVGIIARAAEVGLGTTDGYTFNYNTQSGYLQINLAIDEAPVRAVVEEPFRLSPTNRYRLVFSGAGTLLLGQVFATNNLGVPLFSISGIDDFHAEGLTGIFGFDLNNTGALDVTFDNYDARELGTLRATVKRVSPLPEEMVEAPVDTVTAELLDLETVVVQESIQLDVDGAPVDRSVTVDTGPIVVTYTPAVPLAPDTRHRVRLSFDDGQGVQTFEWSFGPPALPPATELQVATEVTGPYAKDPTATLDEGAKRFTLPRPAGNRFYRIQSDVSRRITSMVLSGGELVVSYQ